METLSVVILAAGQGTRMHSNLPKVLHTIAGKPMLHHVIDAALELKPQNIHLVYGHGGEQVKDRCHNYELIWHHQQQQLGTGHAVQQTVNEIQDSETVLILYGDVPLIKPETLSKLLNQVSASQMALLTVKLYDPQGYGRIIRDQNNRVLAIVEQKDANAEQNRVNEVNTGIMAVKGAQLKTWLSRLENNNAQNEYYLTDIIAMAVADDMTVATTIAENPLEVEGVNNRLQQSRLERFYQRLQAEKLMTQGVTLMDPQRVDIRGSIKVGKDVVIDVNVILEGDVVLEDGVHIGANSVIRNSFLHKQVQVAENCVIEDATLEYQATVGPFARLRPGTHLKKQVHVGNFVEIKNATLGNQTKAGHLSYLGDAEIGENVNIGAGTITCNYDGANKHKTTIGDDVFVGSDSQLVAPVSIEKGATIGAGTTVTSDVKENQLVISRVKQKEIPGWKRPQKKSENQEK